MKLLSNYHSHSTFCDGSSCIEDYILEAIEQGFASYGISSHAPIPFKVKWCMDEKKLKSYIRFIEYLKDKWKSQIEIYKSLEIDYIPGLSGPNSSLIKSINLDYTIGSIHFVDFLNPSTPWEIDGSNATFERGLHQLFKGNVQAAVKRYYELIRLMVTHESPDIVGHLDKIKIQNKAQMYFLENEGWYIQEVLKTLLCIKEKGCMIEVNTRGWYKNKTEDLYPSRWILSEIAKNDIPIVLNSDAHQPGEISKGFEFAQRVLIESGITGSLHLVNGIWTRVHFGNLLMGKVIKANF